MVQFRRIAALLLGIWLGAGIFTDFVVTRNFQQVEVFLAEPGSRSVGVEMNHIGRWKERIIIRRYVGELNNSIFESWEWAELALGPMLFFALAFGERPSKWLLAAPILMMVIVGVQRFYLTPQVAEIGRSLADIAPKDQPKSPLNATFWTLHGIYSGVEILKLAIGAALAVRLSFRSKPDPDYFVKQFEAGKANKGGTKGGRVG